MNAYIKGFEIDLDVFKVIVARRAGSDVTANDVLREAFGLQARRQQSEAPAPHQENWQQPPQRGLMAQGVWFPHGTEFRARYKRQLHAGRIVDGSLMVGGRSYGSPSGAACGLTGTSVNGWIFWQCRLPDTTDWISINSLRR